MREARHLNLETLYKGTAKLESLPKYVEQAHEIAGEGHEVVLTGAAPIWLYLTIAHALHGRAKRLLYESPITGPIVIFDQDPF